MQYGCVLFDENDRISSGWASISGEPAERISGIGDLRNDVIWWSSVSWEAYHELGLSKMPNVLPSDYLRSSMSSIQSEIGAIPRYLGPQKVVSVLSSIFSRVMLLAKNQYGLDYPKQDRLSADLKSILLPVDKPISDHIDMAANQAYQTLVVCVQRTKAKTKPVLFWKPRYQHGMDILSMPVPSNQWEWVPKESLPQTPSKRLKWVLEQERPVLAEAAVIKMNSEYANIISFGSGAGYQRGWIAHPELILLAQYADLDIRSVFLFDRYVPIEEIVKFPPPFADEFGSVSLSIGLLMENYWTAISIPQYERNNTKIYSPRISWIRAADRALLFPAVQRIHELGIRVRSYGTGGITLDVPYGNLSEVSAAANEVGLYSPVSFPEDKMIQEELA